MAGQEARGVGPEAGEGVMAILMLCLEPGCGRLTPERRCPDHKLKAWARRPSRPDLQTAAWRELSRRRREAFPVCEVPGCTRPSTSTDHIVPYVEGGPMTWENTQAVCGKHHAEKTAHGGNRAKARRRARRG